MKDAWELGYWGVLRGLFDRNYYFISYSRVESAKFRVTPSSFYIFKFKVIEILKNQTVNRKM
jgi:hypothetical protein